MLEIGSLGFETSFFSQQCNINLHSFIALDLSLVWHIRAFYVHGKRVVGAARIHHLGKIDIWFQARVGATSSTHRNLSCARPKTKKNGTYVSGEIIMI